MLVIVMALAAAAPVDAALVPGVWASAETAEKCAVAPLSVYMPDGTLIVFDRADGPLHAAGGWSVENGTLVMRYNEAPFSPAGPEPAALRLDILELTSERFVTRTADGKMRTRVRCEGMTAPVVRESGR